MEKQALLGVLPPVIITLFLVAIAWRPWKKSGWPSGAWGSAAGIALGYTAADILTRGWHGPLPRSGEVIHPHIALLAALFVIVTSRAKLAFVRHPLALILTAGVCTLILRVALDNDRTNALKFIAIATVIGMILWNLVAAAAKRTTGARIPLMLWAAATGSSIIFLQNESLSLAQMSGALAAAMGVFVLLGWWRPTLPAVSGAIPVFILVMLGLLIAGRGFAVPWQQSHWSFALAALAVASPFLTTFKPFRRLKPWQGTLLGVITAFALCAGGVALSRNGFDFSGLN